ncbi:hypothetical protein [Roseicella aquatilis]|nr:hypothetical protein [Roseicella aquatilis]
MTPRIRPAEAAHAAARRIRAFDAGRGHAWCSLRLHKPLAEPG